MNGKYVIRILVVALVLSLGVSVVFAGSYGPFFGTSPDSGTCGNNWANDSLGRTGTNFTQHSFIMHFDGSFVTVAGKSPGACESGSDNGNTVQDGVSGSFNGYFTVNVPGGSFNPGAVCTQALCSTTVGFVQTLYGTSAYNTNGPFSFTYIVSGDNTRVWVNDNTGNHGDITGSPVVTPAGPIALFNDGRLNNRPPDAAAPVVIYSVPTGFHFYAINPASQGYLVMNVTCEDIAKVKNPPAINTLIKQTPDKKTRLFRLSTGEFQMNARRADGSDYVFIWSGTKCK